VTETATKYNPWSTYLVAREEARRTGSRRVDTEHLLLALLHESDIAETLGVTIEQARNAVDSLDRSALGILGIHATQSTAPIPMREVPPRPTIKAVLRDRFPMTPAAKAALERAWGPMRSEKQFRAMDVLRQLIELKQPDPVGGLFAALGIDTQAVRSQIERVQSSRLP
jgi:ATP-dependent Clp protease ATP-binding subunit ClpA